MSEKNERQAARLGVETAQCKLWQAARDADRALLPLHVRMAASVLDEAEARWWRVDHSLSPEQCAALVKEQEQEAAEQAVQAALVAVGEAAKRSLEIATAEYYGQRADQKPDERSVRIATRALVAAERARDVGAGEGTDDA